jgi:hypothetical protein
MAGNVTDRLREIGDAAKLTEDAELVPPYRK